MVLSMVLWWEAGSVLLLCHHLVNLEAKEEGGLD